MQNLTRAQNLLDRYVRRIPDSSFRVDLILEKLHYYEHESDLRLQAATSNVDFTFFFSTVTKL